MFGILKKLNITERKNLFYFIALSAILAISSIFLFLGNFKAYRTEISILLVPKSENAFVQTEQILENLSELPHQLSFYDRLLQNGGIVDAYSGKTQDQRKALWNKSLNIWRNDGGSIITIGIDAKKRSESLNISKLAVNTLFSSASKYYDVKKDIDLRVIDGPITRPVIESLAGLILAGLASGIVLAYIIIAVLQLIIGFIYGVSKKIQQKKVSVKKEDLLPKLPSFEMNVKKTQAVVRQHGAPDNLPVATGQYPFSGESAVQQDIAVEDENAHETSSNSQQRIMPDLSENTEPTEEELKKRLNQLIRGGF